MIDGCRVVAVGLGAAILLWQVGNAIRGALLHPFLAPDVIVAMVLIVGGFSSDARFARTRMIVGFLATAMVFGVATLSAIARDGYSLGRVMTGLGLVPCVACVILLRPKHRS